jgi:hypothetical protein
MGVLNKLGEVLNADVGKVLKADVGDIAKGAAEILRTDVTELVGKKADAPANVGGTTTLLRSGETSQIVGKAPVKITSAMVNRSNRALPEGRQLSSLLPHVVEGFRRDATNPTGQIADDPVMATYLDGSEIVIVEVCLCWDADEARAMVAQRKPHAGENAKLSPDGGWVIGRGSEGAYFGWSRGTLFYGVLAQGGSAGLVRFAEAFPY